MVAEAVKIRAEDGRRVEAANISPFIANLPFGATPPSPSPSFRSFHFELSPRRECAQRRQGSSFRPTTVMHAYEH